MYSGKNPVRRFCLIKMTILSVLPTQVVWSSPPVAFMTGMCASAEWEEISNKVQVAKIIAHNGPCEKNQYRDKALIL